MRILSIALLSAVMVFSLFGGNVTAQGIDLQGKWGIGVTFSYSNPSLKDMNQFFTDVNDYYLENYDIAETSLEFDALSGISGEIRYGVFRNIVMGIGLKNQTKSQSVTYSGTYYVYEGDAVISRTRFTEVDDWSISAVPLELNVYYYFPAGPFQVFAGAGGSYYSCHAEVIKDVIDEYGNFYEDFPGLPYNSHTLSYGKTYWDGSGIGFQAKLGGEYFVNSLLAVGIQGSYNYANIEELNDFEAAPLSSFDSDGIALEDQPVKFDMTGFDVSMGLRIYF